MKGIVDRYGFLSILRKGKKKKQFCSRNSSKIQCGDWCPLFDDTHIMGIVTGAVRICNDIVIRLVKDDRKEK